MTAQISTPIQPNRKGGLAFTVVFGLVWAGLTLVADWFVLRGAVRQVVSEYYATAPGQVTHTGLKEVRGSRGSVSYAPDIKFDYEVEGQKYAGDRFRYGQPYTKRQFAENTIAEFPVGAAVTVYYRPGDPADSLLHPGLMGSDLFAALFLVPFNIIAFGLWWAVLGQIAARRWPLPAGGAKIIDDGFQVRIRLGTSPLVPAIVTVGVLSLIAIFAVAYSTGGGSPPMPLILAVWGVVLTAGLIAMLMQWSKLISGSRDLVIDDTARTMTLPATMGRKESLAIPIDKVTGIDLRRVTHQTSKGSTSTGHVPTIYFSAGGGPQRSEPIVEWQDERRAHALATWIGLRLRGQQAVDGLT